MINETITKEKAKAIVNRKNKLIFISAIIGLLICAVMVYRELQNLTLTLVLVMPITTIITALAIGISLFLQEKILTNKKYSLDNEMISITSKFESTKIKIEDITEIKEKKTGLFVRSKFDSAFLPIWLENYQKFKENLN